MTFWGVRGSTSSSGPDVAVYGGATPCLEVRVGGRLVVLDAGTGIRALGEALKAEAPRAIDVLFSHSHYDHVEGLPFFDPLFRAETHVRFWSGHLGGGPGTTARLIEEFMRRPYFPVGPEVFRASVEYRDFAPGDTLALSPAVSVATCRLNHPGGGVGYRFADRGRILCYLSDHEHGDPVIDAELARFAAGADVAVIDAMYSDAEYHRFKGYGHSTWQKALAFADRAGIKRLVLFHHHPDAVDDELHAIAEMAVRERPGTLVASTGLTLEL